MLGYFVPCAFVCACTCCTSFVFSMSNKTFEFLKLQPSRVANVYVAKTTSDVKYEKYEQEEQMNASLSFRNFRSSEVGGWVRVFLKRYVLSLPARPCPFFLSTSLFPYAGTQPNAVSCLTLHPSECGDGWMTPQNPTLLTKSEKVRKNLINSSA